MLPYSRNSTVSYNSYIKSLVLQHFSFSLQLCLPPPMGLAPTSSPSPFLSPTPLLVYQKFNLNNLHLTHHHYLLGNRFWLQCPRWVSLRFNTSHVQRPHSWPLQAWRPPHQSQPAPPMLYYSIRNRKLSSLTAPGTRANNTSTKPDCNSTDL